LATTEKAFYTERRECDDRHAAERAQMDRRHAIERADIAAREEAARQLALDIITKAETEATSAMATLSMHHQKILVEAGGITRRTATASVTASTSTTKSKGRTVTSTPPPS
jgi:uncharacterized membrane protein